MKHTADKIMVDGSTFFFSLIFGQENGDGKFVIEEDNGDGCQGRSGKNI